MGRAVCILIWCADFTISMLILLSTCLLLAGPGPSRGQITDLVNTLWMKGGYSGGNYSIMFDRLNATGHLRHLMRDSNITVFLPTDDAIKKAPPEFLTSLTKDPALATKIMDFHIDNQQRVRLTFRREHGQLLGVVNDILIHSMAGLDVRINSYRDAGIFTAEGVEVVEPNIKLTNGYLHGLGGIMLPPEGPSLQLIENHPNLTTFTSLLALAGIRDDMNVDNTTIFAPSNAAFDKMDKAVIDYLQKHVDQLKSPPVPCSRQHHPVQCRHETLHDIQHFRHGTRQDYDY